MFWLLEKYGFIYYKGKFSLTMLKKQVFFLFCFKKNIYSFKVIESVEYIFSGNIKGNFVNWNVFRYISFIFYQVDSPFLNCNQVIIHKIPTDLCRAGSDIKNGSSHFEKVWPFIKSVKEKRIKISLADFTGLDCERL